MRDHRGSLSEKLKTVACLHTTETDGASGYTTTVHAVLPVRLASVLQIRNRHSVGHTLYVVRKVTQRSAQEFHGNCTCVNGK